MVTRNGAISAAAKRLAVDGDVFGNRPHAGDEPRPDDGIQGVRVHDGEQVREGVRTGHPATSETECVAQAGSAKPPEPGHRRDGATPRERRHQSECEQWHKRVKLALGIPRILQLAKPLQQRHHSHDELPSQERTPNTNPSQNPQPQSVNGPGFHRSSWRTCNPFGVRSVSGPTQGARRSAATLGYSIEPLWGSPKAQLQN